MKGHCDNNLWKSKCMALEKPGKLREFSLLLCGHPVNWKKAGERENA